MTSNNRRISGIFALTMGLAALSGCAPQKPQVVAPAPEPDQSLTKDAAIQQAQRDAAFRYAEVQVARIDAQRQGGFWVVELLAANGSGLRYTISAQDGSIRQRSLFQ